jgi:hypothetical protein
MGKTNNMTTFHCFLIAFFILSWSIVVANCKGGNDMGDHPAKYFFEMDKNAQAEFFRKLDLVKIGDSIQRVKGILGEPTYDQKLEKKKGDFAARVLSYYIKIFQKGLANEKYDRYILLMFDAHDKLTKVESNIEGFAGKIGK